MFTHITQYRGVHACVVHTNHTISWCSYVCGTHQLQNIMNISYVVLASYIEILLYSKRQTTFHEKNTQKIKDRARRTHKDRQESGLCSAGDTRLFTVLHNIYDI